MAYNNDGSLAIIMSNRGRPCMQTVDSQTEGGGGGGGGAVEGAGRVGVSMMLNVLIDHLCLNVS